VNVHNTSEVCSPLRQHRPERDIIFTKGPPPATCSSTRRPFSVWQQNGHRRHAQAAREGSHAPLAAAEQMDEAVKKRVDQILGALERRDREERKERRRAHEGCGL